MKKSNWRDTYPWIMETQNKKKNKNNSEGRCLFSLFCVAANLKFCMVIFLYYRNLQLI